MRALVCSATAPHVESDNVVITLTTEDHSRKERTPRCALRCGAVCGCRLEEVVALRGGLW